MADVCPLLLECMGAGIHLLVLRQFPTSCAMLHRVAWPADLHAEQHHGVVEQVSHL